jgi:hypothetical protein
MIESKVGEDRSEDLGGKGFGSRWSRWDRWRKGSRINLIDRVNYDCTNRKAALTSCLVLFLVATAGLVPFFLFGMVYMMFVVVVD